jgi:hypothetical protein
VVQSGPGESEPGVIRCKAGKGLAVIALLVGPSGVGKTKTYEAVESRFPRWTFRHLDGLASDYAKAMGWIAKAEVSVLNSYAKNRDHFLAIGLQAVADLVARNDGRHLVIDVGAGFQVASYATRLPNQYPTIALLCDETEAHRRWQTRPDNKGTLEEYRRVEFAEARRVLYERAHEKIDTTQLTIAHAADALAAALRRLLPE